MCICIKGEHLYIEKEKYCMILIEIIRKKIIKANELQGLSIYQPKYLGTGSSHQI